MPSNDGFVGTQPVRALEHNVLAWFEDKYPEFRRELEGIGTKYGTARTLRYFCDQAPILGHEEGSMTPYVTVSTGEIGIHETFLSYVWGLSYAFLVIFDEQVHGPRTGKVPGHGKPLGYFLTKGYNVLNYALGLITRFEKWPSELPNPEIHDNQDRYFVERANGIYLAAVDFILCHELAHVACGHLTWFQDNPGCLAPNQVKAFEREADQWALAKVSKGIRQPDRSVTTVGFGALVGLSSLLFLNRELTSKTHPDKNDRIRNVLLGLPIDDRDNLWGIVATAYMVWDHWFTAGLNFSGEFSSYRALVESIDGQPAKRKQAPSVRRLGLD